MYARHITGYDNLAGTGIPTKTFIDRFAAKEQSRNWNYSIS